MIETITSIIQVAIEVIKNNIAMPISEMTGIATDWVLAAIAAGAGVFIYRSRIIESIMLSTILIALLLFLLMKMGV